MIFENKSNKKEIRNPFRHRETQPINVKLDFCVIGSILGYIINGYLSIFFRFPVDNLIDIAKLNYNICVYLRNVVYPPGVDSKQNHIWLSKPFS